MLSWYPYLAQSPLPALENHRIGHNNTLSNHTTHCPNTVDALSVSSSSAAAVVSPRWRKKEKWSRNEACCYTHSVSQCQGLCPLGLCQFNGQAVTLYLLGFLQGVVNLGQLGNCRPNSLNVVECRGILKQPESLSACMRQVPWLHTGGTSARGTWLINFLK